MPDFASNPTFIAPVAAPYLGQPTKVAMTGAQRANGFVPGMPVAAEHLNSELNALTDAAGRALSSDGGTYALQSDLELDGPGALVISGRQAIAADGALDLEDSAVLRIKGHANLDVESLGDINVKSGGDINVNDGGDIDVEDGGSINLASGGALVAASGALVQVATAGGITIDNASVTFRLTLTPVTIAESAGDTVWKGEIQGTWYAHLVGITNGYIVFALPLRVGDLLTTLRCTFDGGTGLGHAAGSGLAPGTPQLFELFETDLDGTPNVIAAAFDGYTMPSYDNPHAVTMSGGALPYTVTVHPLYVRVKCEAGANAVAGTTRLCSIDGTLIARSFRGANEIY